MIPGHLFYHLGTPIWSVWKLGIALAASFTFRVAVGIKMQHHCEKASQTFNSAEDCPSGIRYGSRLLLHSSVHGCFCIYASCLVPQRLSEHPPLPSMALRNRHILSSMAMQQTSSVLHPAPALNTCALVAGSNLPCYNQKERKENER